MRAPPPSQPRARVYTLDGVRGGVPCRAAVSRCAPVWPMHLKVDTGMHRVGCAPDEALDLDRPSTVVPSSCSAASGPRRVEDEPTTLHAPHWPCLTMSWPHRRRGRRSRSLMQRIRQERSFIRPRATTCAMRDRDLRAGALPPEVRRSSPNPGYAGDVVAVCVSFVKVVAAGDGVSYGLRHTFDTDTVVATVPSATRRRGPQPRARRRRGARRPPAARSSAS